MGSQHRTSGHNKSANRPYRCPKVLGKPIHVDKSSPRYCVDIGTYSLHRMSDEFPRFLDIIEYSTNAMFYPQKYIATLRSGIQTLLTPFMVVGDTCCKNTK